MLSDVIFIGKPSCMHIDEHDEELGSEHLTDEFIAELDRRAKSFEDGTAKMYTWEENKQMARDMVQEKREAGK